jgi:hypothetical protein
MNTRRHVLQLAWLVLFCMPGMSAHAQQPPVAVPLLGKIEDNRYIAPQQLFRVPLPFTEYDPANHIIHDGVLPGSLNVLFEDTQKNRRYRIELSEQPDLTDAAKIKQAAERRLTAYEGLLLRAFKGSALTIHFATPARNVHEYYYRQDGEDSRYHLFVFFKRGQHLVMLWTDFIETDVTPALEDTVINGEHAAIQTTRQLYKALSNN